MHEGTRMAVVKGYDPIYSYISGNYIYDMISLWNLNEVECFGNVEC
jgi:hypothetical protein